MLFYIVPDLSCRRAKWGQVIYPLEHFPKLGMNLAFNQGLFLAGDASDMKRLDKEIRRDVRCGQQITYTEYGFVRRFIQVHGTTKLYQVPNPVGYKRFIFGRRGYVDHYWQQYETDLDTMFLQDCEPDLMDQLIKSSSFEGVPLAEIGRKQSPEPEVLDRPDLLIEQYNRLKKALGKS